MKLFISDYDGTLYTDDKKIKKTNKLLKKLKEKDFLIVIATGRSYPSIHNQTIIHQIPYDYLICSDGSVIYDNKDSIIKMDLLNKEIVKPFEKFYENVKFDEIQYSYPEGFSNILRNDNDNLIGLNICLATIDYTKELVDRFNKMEEVYPSYSFLNYMHPNYSYLCIKPKGISKSSAIEYLRRKNKIIKTNVYVIGDSSNDYEMIRDYQGSCISSSFPEVLTIAKNKYPSIDNYINDILKDN